MIRQRDMRSAPVRRVVARTMPRQSLIGRFGEQCGNGPDRPGGNET